MSEPYTTPEPPRRKRRFSLRRLFKGVFLIVCCVALVFLAKEYGPALYRRIFGNGNTVKIRERLNEELKEKNELVVFEATLTEQQSVSQNAWLIGKVQEVVVPYTFSIAFTVDMSKAVTSVEDGNINVRLPAPVASYHRLDVDKDKVTKYDWLYPLTTERYAEIVDGIEKELYSECAANAEYLDAAWITAVKDVKSIFQTIADQSDMGATCDVVVTMDETLGLPAATEAPESEPTAAPAENAA